MTSGNMTLGEIIRYHRQQQGLSQPELASKAQIEQSYLSKLENDNSYPSDDILKRILSGLDLDIADLCAQLDIRSADPKVMHIESIRTYMGRFQQQSQRRSVFLMAIFTLTIGIGCALFYAGYSEAFFPEKQYSYQSRGEIQPGEPTDYFEGGWRREFPAGAYRPFSSSEGSPEGEAKQQLRQAQVDQANRVNYHSIQSFQPLGSIVERQLDNGNRRLYRLVGSPTQVSRAENGWLMLVGITLTVSGVIGLLLVLRLGSFRGYPLGNG
ncbi:helix-turn-helix domain-containing protein [Aliidiomarina soli]|nr:helix-turn-helix transcriptional regulator [Aliidiomarina soli]